jgi:hypothetical protein
MSSNSSDQVHQQAWRADVKAVLRQLHKGPSLKDTQLRNLRITFRPPSPIPVSQLVREHLPTFLETEDGRNITSSLFHKSKYTILKSEYWSLGLCTEGTGLYIGRCIDRLYQIWGDGSYPAGGFESHLTIF